MELVTAREGRLWAGEEPYRFMGTNCYFLQEEGAREAMRWENYAGRVEEAMQKVSGLGMTAVRAWAMHDDPDNPAAMQVAPLTYNQDGLRGVDLVLALAARYGVRLLLCLGNYWEDYGGVPQYLKWHGLPPSEPHLFFRTPEVVDHYGEHIQRLLRRTNSITGIPWGEDPAVLGWELMNEPRGKGLDDNGEVFRAWVRAMTGRVREAAKQLVLTGEEGMGDDLVTEAPLWEGVGAGWMVTETGQDFEKNTAEVDVASAHLYPETWGWDPARVEEAGQRWIRSRAEAAARAGRPLVLGEFGLSNEGNIQPQDRRRIYQAWMETVLATDNVCGALSWSFATDDRPDEWDDFTWRWHTGTSPADPINLYADLHQEWARRMRAA